MEVEVIGVEVELMGVEEGVMGVEEGAMGVDVCGAEDMGLDGIVEEWIDGIEGRGWLTA